MDFFFVFLVKVNGLIIVTYDLVWEVYRCIANGQQVMRFTVVFVNSPQEISNFKGQLIEVFEIKDIGTLEYFLQIKISQFNSRNFYISKITYLASFVGGR